MIAICRKVKFSPFFLLIIFIAFLSGLFYDVLSFLFVIIMHEIGHIITSLIFKWKVKRVDITLCGGFITYDDKLDKPFKEELLVSISGFLAQGILFIILFTLNKIYVIDASSFFMINKYSLAIFLFNLLPIYPLDGSKILSVILNALMPYKRSLKCLFYVSLLIIILIVVTILLKDVKIEASYVIIFSFIIKKLISLYKDIPYLFNRLLFERYIYYYPDINKYNYINGKNLSLFKRRRKNYFYINGHYHSERSILKERFD